MTTKIEEVADALERRFKETIAASAGMTFEETKVSLPGRAIWIGYATAAIEAMREPTPEMNDVGMDANPRGRTISDSDLDTIYAAMIDAALAERS